MVNSALAVILPKKRANPKGTGYTPTFNPQNADQILTVPGYRDHTVDIFTSRTSDDSRTLIQNLFKHDPDVSASVNAYLTVASSVDPWWIVYDESGVIDPAGHETLLTILNSLFSKNDYSVGFQLKPSMAQFFDELRYMLLLRGGIGNELVLDKSMLPIELRHIDLSTVQWREKQSGVLKPVQIPAGSSDEINLDMPTFFVQFFKRDPTSIYSFSHFVSAINTIAARQQVVNDLYRIMRKTGYPRMHIKVVEEVLRKNAPADARADENQMNLWMQQRLQEISTAVSTLSVDQAFVHSDAVEPGMMNEKSAGVALDIKPMIETLNAQNQAGLKTMATIIGRGEAGVNTASVESRIFSMHADALNAPISAFMSDVLTLALRLSGSTSRVEFGFDKVELRTELETEPQKTMKQNRLLMLLSEGVITDDDFHIEMFGRPKPAAVAELSGTKFMTPTKTADTPDGTATADPSGDAQQQSNSVERAASREGSGAARGSDSTRKAAA